MTLLLVCFTGLGQSVTAQRLCSEPGADPTSCVDAETETRVFSPGVVIRSLEEGARNKRHDADQGINVETVCSLFSGHEKEVCREFVGLYVSLKEVDKKEEVRRWISRRQVEKQTSDKNGSGPGILVTDCSVQTDIPETECTALVDLFTATAGTSWSNRNGWNETQSPCSWYGITCQASRVTAIQLPLNFLFGSLPASLGNLTSVTTLDLGSNQIFGALPSSFGNLLSLRSLDLSVNFFNGSLPASMGALSQLQTVTLFFNEFEGPIPASWSGLTSLREFDAFLNKLTGPLPASFAQASALQRLDLGSNLITGPIPAAFGDFASLTDLNLNGNSLSGAIPAELGNLSTLETLDLGANDLSGSLPPDLGMLPSLEALILYENELSGPIPADFGQLTSLQLLVLGANTLTGAIPTGLGLISGLRVLDLGDNRLSGSVPESLGQLTVLEGFNLSNNVLTGIIPLAVADAGAGAESRGACDFTGNPSSFLLPAKPGYLSLAGSDGIICGLALTVIPQRVVTVKSTFPFSGVSIVVSPADNNGRSDGSTEFARTYDENTVVSLQAPIEADGNPFTRWQCSGGVTGTNPILQLTMTADDQCTAEYLNPQVVLDVRSIDPESGVIVSVSPPDDNLDADGTTPFSRMYPRNTVATLTAPAMHESKTFVNWMCSDGTLGVEPTLEISLAQNVTCTALYGLPSNVLDVTVSGPAGGIPVEVFPDDLGALGSGTTPFSRQYTTGTSVSLLAPESDGLLVFSEWTCTDGFFSADNPVNVFINEDKTCTAAFVLPEFPVTVLSSGSPAEALVSLSPSDVNDTASVETPETATFYAGTEVLLTAPEQIGFALFEAWVCSDGTSAQTPTITLTISMATTCTVSYVTPEFTIGITAVGAGANLQVDVVPDDLDNQGSGQVPFSRRFANGTNVMLTAPAFDDGNPFVSWNCTDGTFSDMQVLEWTASRDVDCTATYGLAIFPLHILSPDPADIFSVSVSPPDTAGLEDGQPPFARTYDSGTFVTLVVQEFPAGKIFEKWTCDNGYESAEIQIEVTLIGPISCTILFTKQIYTVSVTSENPDSGVDVDVQPLSVNMAGSGATPFMRSYEFGTEVNLTAPSQSPIGVFDGWICDDGSMSGTETLVVTIRENIGCTARYFLPPVTITILSISPDLGVNVSYSPADAMGETDNSTPFQAVFESNANVTLIAPANSDGSSFLVWSCSNGLVSSLRQFTFAPTLDVTCTVTYRPAERMLTVVSSDASVEVPVLVSPSDLDASASGQTPVVFRFENATEVTLTAPETLPGNLERPGWTCTDGRSAAGPSIVLTITDDVQCAVEYSVATVILALESQGSVLGVTIAVSPVDLTGLGGGTPPFSRRYDRGETVTLTAPVTSGNAIFSHWSCGAGNTFTREIQPRLNVETTCTVFYSDLTVQLALPPDTAEKCDRSPVFSWEAANDGVSYELEISSLADFSIGRQTVSNILQPSYTWPESNLLQADGTGGSVFWRVRAVDGFGVTGPWSLVRRFTILPVEAGGTCPTLTGLAAEAPVGTVLYPVYPNPAGRAANLTFSLENPDNVRIQIFDVSGKTVLTLTDQPFSTGNHRIEFVTDRLPAGVYFVAMESGKTLSRLSFIVSR